MLSSPLCSPVNLPHAIELLLDHGFTISEEKSEEILNSEEQKFAW